MRRTSATSIVSSLDECQRPRASAGRCALAFPAILLLPADMGQAVGDGAGFDDHIDWPKIRLLMVGLFLAVLAASKFVRIGGDTAPEWAPLERTASDATRHLLV